MTDLPHPSLDQTVEFTVAGRHFTLSGAQVLAKARAAVHAGLPPAAHNYVAWAAVIDGQLIGLKWVFSLVTGLPRSAFVAGEARSAFERLGLEVRRVESGPGPAPPKPQREPAAAGPHAVLDAEIARIHDFLRGHGSRPSDEKLCDWVHFCYTFQLYREGRDLFRLVDPTQVHPWHFERTQRLARVCAMRAQGRP